MTTVPGDPELSRGYAPFPSFVTWRFVEAPRRRIWFDLALAMHSNPDVCHVFVLLGNGVDIDVGQGTFGSGFFIGRRLTVGRRTLQLFAVGHDVWIPNAEVDETT